MRPGLCKASSICLRFLVVAIKTTPSCFSNLHSITTSCQLLLTYEHIFILRQPKEAKHYRLPIKFHKQLIDESFMVLIFGMNISTTYTSKQVKILHKYYHRSLQIATNKSGKRGDII